MLFKKAYYVGVLKINQVSINWWQLDMQRFHLTELIKQGTDLAHEVLL